jgi:hypothetical protein
MAKKKTPEGERCERTLPFKLNDEDLARKGELAAKLNNQLDAAEANKKRDLATHNEKIKILTEKRDKQLAMIDEGVERRPVTCTAVKNFAANIIEFWFEGQVMESIEMKPEDRQLTLAEKAAKEKGNEKPKERWQKMAPKYPAKNQAVEDDKDAEIASVHKLETSKKGANSMVDPK